jgi:hypothetical protein
MVAVRPPSTGQRSRLNPVHKHPDHPCGCKWDGSWRLVYAPPTEAGAIPITTVRHPASQSAVGTIPNPDYVTTPASWAHSIRIPGGLDPRLWRDWLPGCSPTWAWMGILVMSGRNGEASEVPRVRPGVRSRA